MSDLSRNGPHIAVHMVSKGKGDRFMLCAAWRARNTPSFDNRQRTG